MAERTGTGHKSVANALEKRLKKSEYDVKQVDIFESMGTFGRWLEKSYIPITTKCPPLFYLAFLFTQICPHLNHGLMYINLKKRLKKEIEEYKPDLIISAHSMFTQAISHLLKKEKMNIPFYINVIDLVKPPKVWFDKRADMVFVPTSEVKEDYIKKDKKEEEFLKKEKKKNLILKTEEMEKIKKGINTTKRNVIKFMLIEQKRQKLDEIEKVKIDEMNKKREKKDLL